MTATSEDHVSGAHARPATAYPPRSAVGGWLLFDWAAQPYFTLITTFVFAPYFTTYVASDPASGQAMWGFAAGVAGLVIALLSPVLGAVADAAGRRKPWIAGFGLLLMIGTTLLWFGKPGRPDLVALVLMAYAIGTVGVEFATVFNNAMMPALVPPERLGRLSGTGWAVGYVGGIVSLIVVLGLLAADPNSGRTLFGLAPLFGLDPATHEGARISGPLTAVWFAVFVLPLFLLTPDQPSKRPVSAAVREGIIDLRRSLAALPGNKPLLTFLIANMIYMDGLISLFAFGGIYAAGTFGWNTIQIGTFGLILAVAGTLGAWLGGKLDDRIGPRRVIVMSLIMLLTSLALILLIDRDRILFVQVPPPVPGGPLFGAAAERAYLLIGVFIGFAAGPLQAASRTLLIRLAPVDKITQHFGLFALTGKVTSFVGPLLVASITAATLSQKAGMVVLIGFFLIGLGLLSRIRPSLREAQL
ncbi:MFS transporter [Bradyrhizobium sp. LHD-71]|uniref:MFS transporter n=1 Tax=Bradyrhizobium sp. LHD-71 TaxID=3072141 RepID=UPI002810049E|nr:MFS transporter [Bradyrhizobium sp. LHD-71]MDQ8732860.1 MFS transporter [Bradyrhizobium sp. LHD-71]